jgi:excisionase family DNA binding protein
MTFNRFLITVEEAVLLTGVSRSALYVALKNGTLPSRVIGSRRRRILVADLERFIGAPINVGQRATA